MNSKTSEEATPSPAGSVREALAAPVEAPVAVKPLTEKYVMRLLRKHFKADLNAFIWCSRTNGKDTYRPYSAVMGFAREIAATPRPLPSVDRLAKEMWLAGFRRAFDREPNDPWENQGDSVKKPHLDTATAILTLRGGSAHGR